MIIECKNCNKKFNVDQNLIPENGRKIQCGSCNHSWYFRVEKLPTKPLFINEEIIQKENFLEKNKSDKFEINYDDSGEISFNDKSFDKTKEIIKNSNSSSFFSYLVIFIVSILALVILVDTFKTPLIKIFPNLEIILFNLFETLKDIKLFIIDLT